MSETALTTLTIENPALYVGGSTGDLEYLLSRIETEVRSHVPDIDTKRGREAIASLAHRVRRTKTALDDAGKGLTEAARQQIKAIDEARRIARTRLDALAEEVRRPLTDWEAKRERQSQRGVEIERSITENLINLDSATSIEIGHRIDHVRELAITEEAVGADLHPQLNDARASALRTLAAARDRAMEREAREAELERLRQEREERERRERLVQAAVDQLRDTRDRVATAQESKLTELLGILDDYSVEPEIADNPLIAEMSASVLRAVDARRADLRREAEEERRRNIDATVEMLRGVRSQITTANQGGLDDALGLMSSIERDFDDPLVRELCDSCRQAIAARRAELAEKAKTVERRALADQAVARLQRYAERAGKLDRGNVGAAREALRIERELHEAGTYGESAAVTAALAAFGAAITERVGALDEEEGLARKERCEDTIKLIADVTLNLPTESWNFPPLVARLRQRQGLDYGDRSDEIESAIIGAIRVLEDARVMRAGTEANEARQRAEESRRAAEAQRELERIQREEADAARRAADEAHRSAVMEAAAEVLASRFGMTPDLAIEIIEAIVNGEIPHLRVEF